MGACRRAAVQIAQRGSGILLIGHVERVMRGLRIPLERVQPGEILIVRLSGARLLRERLRERSGLVVGKAGVVLQNAKRSGGGVADLGVEPGQFGVQLFHPRVQRQKRPRRVGDLGLNRSALLQKMTHRLVGDRVRRFVEPALPLELSQEVRFLRRGRLSRARGCKPGVKLGEFLDRGRPPIRVAGCAALRSKGLDPGVGLGGLGAELADLARKRRALGCGVRFRLGLRLQIVRACEDRENGGGQHRRKGRPDHPAPAPPNSGAEPRQTAGLIRVPPARGLRPRSSAPLLRAKRAALKSEIWFNIVSGALRDAPPFVLR